MAVFFPTCTPLSLIPQPDGGRFVPSASIAPLDSHLTILCFKQLIRPRAAFVSAHEALDHLKSLKPELDLIAEANTKRSERQARARENPTEPPEQPSDLEKTWIGRDQQLGLYQVVVSVRVSFDLSPFYKIKLKLTLVTFWNNLVDRSFHICRAADT